MTRTTTTNTLDFCFTGLFSRDTLDYAGLIPKKEHLGTAGARLFYTTDAVPACHPTNRVEALKERVYDKLQINRIESRYPTAIMFHT